VKPTQIAIFGAIVVAITKPFGFYMTRVFVGEWTPLSPLLRPVERLVYRGCGVEESEEQSWRLYAISMVLFGATGRRLSDYVKGPRVRIHLPPAHLSRHLRMKARRRSSISAAEAA
jgi:K+-transporting ATPase A subunit